VAWEGRPYCGTVAGMGVSPPSLPDLRALAASQGIENVEDADLEAARAILAALLSALDELERIVPPGTAPAALLPREP
jgi:hypothetical protein